jgi:hypothetical protein
LTYDTLYEAEKAYYKKLQSALEDLLDHYIRMVKSGDCGNWNPETEPVVIKARKALEV